MKFINLLERDMFNLEITYIAGWLAGIVGFAAFLPYFISIHRNETTPNRATWLIWTIVSTISLLSYEASGAEQTIWYPLSDAVAPFIVLLLAIKHGENGWNRLDRACLLIAIISALLWWISGSALIGLCMNLVADAMGALPTAIKAYQRPESESRVAWTITFLATLINLGAVQNWNSFAILVYPIYMLTCMGTITAFLWLCPKKQNRNYLLLK